MARLPLLLAGLAAAAATSCGGRGGAATRAEDLSQFECNSRRVEYMVAGGFVAPEAGIRLECERGGPRLTSWSLQESGERSSKTHPLTAAQFDGTWKRIDATGWRFLQESCPGATAIDGDPIYTIDVGDHAASVSLTCRGKELPFPYDRLVNELDLRAAGLGDGQPAP